MSLLQRAEIPTRLPSKVRRSATAWIALFLLGALALPAVAQIPGLAPGNAPPPAAEPVADPFGRSTPYGTILGFIRAVDRGDYVSAVRYMQVAPGQKSRAGTLARDLKSLMDDYFSQTLVSISNEPNGALDDGLAMNRERVGPLVIGKAKHDITLVRVTIPEVGPIWLISSETFALVPALSASAGQSWIERAMPEALVQREMFGVSLAHWAVLLLSLAIPFAAIVLVLSLIMFAARRVLGDTPRRHALERLHARIRWPAVAALTLTVQLLWTPSLGFPLAFRMGYARVGLTLAVIAFAWLLRSLLGLAFDRARSMLRGRERMSTASLMLLAERMTKALVIVAAGFAILRIVGVDTKTALAGLGIGGVALALGAQKTVENLLGGIFLLSDKVLAIGDECSIGNRVGRVEDISLRSVRLRTTEQTLVSVPAGVLAQSGIENFASRKKILVQSTLRLRHGTSVDQLKRILEGIRTLLAGNGRLEAESSRIRLVNFGEQAVELELFAYVLTSDGAEFLAVREELLLAIAAIVEAEGSAFAQTAPVVVMEGTPAVVATARKAGVPEPAMTTVS